MSRRVSIGLGAFAALALVSLAVRLATAEDEPEAVPSECAASGIERALPPEFPRSFPLPPGTRATETAVSAFGTVFVRGYAPVSAPEAIAFFRDEPPRAGWRVAPPQGEVEGAGVTAGFRGPGYTGNWTVDELPGCPAAALLTLRFRRR